MTDCMITKSIIDNLVEMMSMATKNSSHPKACAEKMPGYIQYFTDCPFPFFNGVFQLQELEETELAKNLDTITDYFAPYKRPFVWWWTDSKPLPLKMKNVLESKGFQFQGDFYAIAAKLNEIIFSEHNTEETEIREVETVEDYQTFIEILSTVFGFDNATKKSFFELSSSYGRDSKLQHYLYFYKGQPIATGSTYIEGNVVGLYNGATLSEFQKKGACTALAEYVLKKNSHCEYAISQLMATAMAKGLTANLGFKTYSIILPFMKMP